VTLVEAALLGVVQGITEFLPISSSAHLILARAVFGWDAGELNRAFDVACHLGTLVAVITFFRADLAAMVRALPGAFRTPVTPDARRIWLIAAATLPIVIVGVLFSDLIDVARDNARATAVAMLLGAGLLFLVERLGPRTGSESSLTMAGAVLVGMAQAVALIPGVSRSGASITAGMLLGLHRLSAARFSFLIGIPAIAAAGANEALQLRAVELTRHDWALFGVGVVSSAAVGYLAISVLLKFLVTHRLDVFGWYRIAVAIAILVWL
jgi:undecaprenyl-diphosphatase